MIGRLAHSHEPRREADECGSAFKDSVELISLLPDWPLACGRLRLGTGAMRPAARHKAKVLLASKLWTVLELTDAGSPPLFAPVDVTSDRLGRPLLVVADQRIANLSFSYCDGNAWAVVSEPSWCSGIDVSQRREFGEGYPFRRVFSSAELFHGNDMTCGDTAEAAALLWSAKEAAVKAVGWGFHFLEPRDVRLEIRGPLWIEPGCQMWACLTAPRAMGGSRFGQVQIPVRTVRMEDCWVSVARMQNKLNGCQQLRD